MDKMVIHLVLPFQFYMHFGMGKAPEEMGKGRDWNVDLIPKFLMANGKIISFAFNSLFIDERTVHVVTKQR